MCQQSCRMLSCRMLNHVVCYDVVCWIMWYVRCIDVSCKLCVVSTVRCIRMRIRNPKPIHTCVSVEGLTVLGVANIDSTCRWWPVWVRMRSGSGPRSMACRFFVSKTWFQHFFIIFVYTSVVLCVSLVCASCVCLFCESSTLALCTQDLNVLCRWAVKDLLWAELRYAQVAVASLTCFLQLLQWLASYGPCTCKIFCLCARAHALIRLLHSNQDFTWWSCIR